MMIGKHLLGAMLMTAPGVQGLCIHRSAGFVLDTRRAELCFGTFEPAVTDDPRASTEPFIHAWAELDGLVYAPTLIETMGGLMPMDRQSYYGVNGARDIKRLARVQVMRLSREFGLGQHLLDQTPLPPGVSFGGTLMDAAGVRWRDSEKGGIIPA